MFEKILYPTDGETQHKGYPPSTREDNIQRIAKKGVRICLK